MSNDTTTKRYTASEEPGHGCCWRASVMDTHVNSPFHRPHMVCECDDMEMAQHIADLLNAAYDSTSAEALALTCDDCKAVDCEFRGDEYNTNGDCLASK